MNDKMRAVRIHEFGGTEQLTLDSIDIPSPGSDEVLVRIKAAAVNPVDWKIREGYLREVMEHPLPLTLGWDFSGEIVALGENVTHFKVGEAVFSRPDIAKNGAYADYIVVAASEIAAKPSTLNWQEAAAIPLAALTAWQVLYETANIQKGQSVLIQAGAGGVGVMAIQLAKLRGATVYTTASEKNHSFLLELGADKVIDYRREDYSKLRGLDVVFDTLGGEDQHKALATLKKGGKLVSIVDTPDESVLRDFEVEGHFVFVQPSAEQLNSLAEYFDKGQLKVEIDSTFPLEDAAKAHAKIETARTRGKIVLDLT